jgi:hypothetical protein
VGTGEDIGPAALRVFLTDQGNSEAARLEMHMKMGFRCCLAYVCRSYGAKQRESYIYIYICSGGIRLVWYSFT